MKTAIEIILLVTASLALLLTRFALLRLHQPTTPLLWAIKVYSSALSPVLMLIGFLSALGGYILGNLPLAILGGLGLLLYSIHIIKIIRSPEASLYFERTVVESTVPPVVPSNAHFLRHRYVLRLPDSPEPIVQRDISFYTIEPSGRQLLCDVWQPNKDIIPSGLAFIYLHGSAWTFLDKDFGTRTFFRHLASQGHVIMDVAYRLFPETDFMGMIHDARHAIAWMKTHAANYGVNPARIVIGGGSAGAHIALLVAFTDKVPHLTPADLQGVDRSVCGVISLYGQSDLSATYYHTAQHLIDRSTIAQRKTEAAGKRPSWMQKKMGRDFHRLGFDKDVEPGMLVPMLGGDPDEKPELYALYSPITYVHSDCPPTLFLHGNHDILAPLEAIQRLQARLTEAGALAAIHVISQADHAFDLILPRISPSAHNAIYDVERFLSTLTRNISRDIPSMTGKVTQ